MKKILTFAFALLIASGAMAQDKAEKKNPFTIDSKAPATDYKEFLMNEARYSALTRSFPERAEKLFNEAAENAVLRYNHLLELQEMFKKEAEA